MKKAKDGKAVPANGREWAKHIRRDGKRVANKATRRHGVAITQEV
jgi:hypothetical protein